MHVRHIEIYPDPGEMPVRGWEEIRRILTDFAEGRYPPDAYWVPPDPLVPGRLLTSREFFEALLATAEGRLRTQGSWIGNYDYDGEGPFFKTSVRLSTLSADRGLYGLDIQSVNDEPQSGLARHLGIERAWSALHVFLYLDPVDRYYAHFDFSQVAPKLHRLFPACTPAGEEMLASMVWRDLLLNYACPFTADGDEYCLEVGVARVEKTRRWVYPNVAGQAPLLEGEWDMRGATMRTLRDLLHHHGDSAVPALDITLSKGSPYRGNATGAPLLAVHAPVFDEQEKERLWQLALAIREALLLES